MNLTKPSFNEEQIYWNQNINIVIGMDEVGRGAFAGPIVAAGVIYKPGFQHKFLDKVNDSKLLKPKTREELSVFIKENSAWAIEQIDLDFINKFGIGRANFEVFRKVLEKLLPKDEYFVLVDGFDLKIKNQKGITKGDRKSLSIASASIIAKVFRDEIMTKSHSLFPDYFFNANKGYGTLKHRDAIKKNGLCRFHRTSFDLTKHFSS